MIVRIYKIVINNSYTVWGKNSKSTGDHRSPLQKNNVFAPFVGDGVLDVPLVWAFFNKLN